MRLLKSKVVSIGIVTFVVVRGSKTVVEPSVVLVNTLKFLVENVNIVVANDEVVDVVVVVKKSDVSTDVVVDVSVAKVVEEEVVAMVVDSMMEVVVRLVVDSINVVE